MPNALDNAGFFLISTLFDLFIFLFLIRFILAIVRANYFNPITIVIDKLTKPLVRPMKKIAPSYKNIETASLLIAIFLELIKFSLLAFIIIGRPNFSGVFILSVADLLKTLINIYFYAILIQAVLSWINASYSPIGELLAKITWPLMRPVRHLIPPVAGLDISPIPILIGLQLMIILFINPLAGYGQALLGG